MTLDNAIAPLATPTRFLIENGEWNLTPNIGGSINNEMNPFDCNFQQRAPPTVKTLPINDSDKWNPSSPTVFTTANLYNSPEPESVAIETATPPTPPMSISQSPSSSSSSFSLALDNNMPINSPPQQNNSLPQEEYNNHEEYTRRSSRIQTKQNFFSEYLESDDKVEYKPKSASVQSGRKRRIVFEGDDAEDRRKKFLERNRVAAYKCRQKKKNWMQELEQKAEIQNSHNDELRALVAQLKEESMYLRNLLLTHGNCDCDSVQAYLRKTSAEITSNSSPLTAPSLTSSRTNSLSSNSTFPSMPSYQGSFSSIPPFAETSTGLTPFLNTVISKQSHQGDYFSQSHINETS
ncbi:unnamed protein product [Mucor hiemalis]